MCVCVYIYIYIYAHTYTHKHIHASNKLSAVRAATASEIMQLIKGPPLPLTGEEGDWGIIDLPIGKDASRKVGDLVSLRKMKVCLCKYYLHVSDGVMECLWNILSITSLVLEIYVLRSMSWCDSVFGQHNVAGTCRVCDGKVGMSKSMIPFCMNFGDLISLRKTKIYTHIYIYICTYICTYICINALRLFSCM
jgi:hypothetical protein